ncbi:MAG TPA: hypothetical protein VKX49_00375, partial [Bryobacteraceae bacterium]|nr:hypothetical protein [Bryobacteraceae bacterium]
LIEETNASGGVVARYAQQGLNIDEPLAMLRSGTTSYYQVDGLKTVTWLSNTAGALAQTYTFDSFGVALPRPSTATKTENRLCASHPMNCCMIGASWCATKSYRVHQALSSAFIRSPRNGRCGAPEGALG